MKTKTYNVHFYFKDIWIGSHSVVSVNVGQAVIEAASLLKLKVFDRVEIK